jgi:signal transduction histidine kinase
VPVFQDQTGERGMHSELVGYLHVAMGGAQAAAQMRFLQGFVLLTCMGVVLVAVPIAGLIARHITVPIQRLARGAHALAAGDLSHRVVVRRSDEIGELARAFNRMADTVQTQRKDIQEINAGLEHKVHERTAALERLNGQLHAEIAEKEDFLRAVSHDLNAPLRNIAGMASMLVLKYKDTLDKDAVQRLERIQKNVQVECELLNELLELSRIKTRREKIERVNLHELMQSVAEGFTSDFETRSITFRLNSQLPVMRGEKSRLRQAFQNLIDNAVKYMRHDGPREIVVSVNYQGDEAVFAVRDSGMGIAADDLPQLFHVFRRAKNAALLKIPGKGVGLATVKSIIENYHGRLWVESTPGVGTTFLFAIPRSHFELVKEVAA